jgi:hypothetical protein
VLQAPQPADPNGVCAKAPPATAVDPKSWTDLPANAPYKALTHR